MSRMKEPAMFTSAFATHTTRAGLAVGIGLIWREGAIDSITLGEGLTEGPWRSSLPPVEAQSAPAEQRVAADLLNDLVGQLEGHGAGRRWAVTPVGTPFQQKVWAALAAIPRGETRTYAEVAQAIGQPTAARAVASACAANPRALLTPCHRVVPRMGGLGGYRWGPRVKAALLAAEGVTPPPAEGHDG
jgi:AraC family transcriptional regulator of adaptative response/methylated-DNA-[protein]-cysteine methyltransferase